MENCVDLEDVRNHIRRLCETYNVRAIGVDPAHNAADTMIILQQEGYPVEPVPCVPTYTNQPMRRLAEMVLDGKLRHAGDSLLNWQAQNLESKTDQPEPSEAGEAQRRCQDRHHDLPDYGDGASPPHPG